MMRHYAAFVALCVWAPGSQAADEIVIPSVPSAAQLAAAPSFGPDARVVATHYFY